MREHDERLREGLELQRRRWARSARAFLASGASLDAIGGEFVGRLLEAWPAANEGARAAPDHGRERLADSDAVLGRALLEPVS